MNLRRWLSNLLFFCWRLTHPREARELAGRILAEMKRRERGFTAIELLIVLAILGILVGMVMMGVGAAGVGIGG